MFSAWKLLLYLLNIVRSEVLTTVCRLFSNAQCLRWRETLLSFSTRTNPSIFIPLFKLWTSWYKELNSWPPPCCTIRKSNVLKEGGNSPDCILDNSNLPTYDYQTERVRCKCNKLKSNHTISSVVWWFSSYIKEFQSAGHDLRLLLPEISLSLFPHSYSMQNLVDNWCISLLTWMAWYQSHLGKHK